MTRKSTLTIGIPAYNEEGNIARLLKKLLAQRQNNFNLKEIIVISDASTDSTDQIVKNFAGRKIRLIRNRTRIGQAMTQNKIFAKFNSDYIVLINADVLPEDRHTIEKIISCFNSPQIGLVGGNVKPIEPKNLLQIILKFSTDLKDELYLKISDINNIYLCHGRFRAFSKLFAKKMRWTAVASEDAFSYLKCLEYGYKFNYCPQATVLYNLPANLKDHLKQSSRFIGTKKNLTEFFDQEIVDRSYYIPLSQLLTTAFKGIMHNPFLFCCYLLVFLYSWIKSILKYNTTYIWEASLSTKKLP